MITFTNEKIIKAVRLCVSIIIAIFIASYFEIPESTWIYISIFVVSVEQNTLGSVLNKSYLRAFATVSSAIFSLTIIFLFNNNDIMNLIGLFFGIFVYSAIYLGTERSYIGTLGIITLGICLINNNNIMFAFMRPFNVLIGISIALFTTYFFFPRHAITKTIVNLHKMLDSMKKSVSDISLNNLHSYNTQNEFSDNENLVFNDFNTAKDLINQSVSELPKTSVMPKICAKCSIYMRKIMRYCSALCYYIFSKNKSSTNEGMFILEQLNQILNLLYENLAINFISFNSNQLISQLNSLKQQILDNKEVSDMSLSILELIIEESIALIKEFKLMQHEVIRNKQLFSSLFKLKN